MILDFQVYALFCMSFITNDRESNRIFYVCILLFYIAAFRQLIVRMDNYLAHPSLSHQFPIKSMQMIAHLKTITNICSSFSNSNRSTRSAKQIGNRFATKMNDQLPVTNGTSRRVVTILYSLIFNFQMSMLEQESSIIFTG